MHTWSVECTGACSVTGSRSREMPMWSVECTGACSVTGKPESTICTYGADPFLDISRVSMTSELND